MLTNANMNAYILCFRSKGVRVILLIRMIIESKVVVEALHPMKEYELVLAEHSRLKVLELWMT